MLTSGNVADYEDVFCADRGRWSVEFYLHVPCAYGFRLFPNVRSCTYVQAMRGQFTVHSACTNCLSQCTPTAMFTYIIFASLPFLINQSHVAESLQEEARPAQINKNSLPFMKTKGSL